MSPAETAALDAIGLRLAHVAATADMVAGTLDKRPTDDVIAGISATLNEIADRLDALANPPTA